MKILHAARYLGLLAVVTVFTTIQTASCELVAYWAFDDHSDFTRTSGSQGTLEVSPEGWFTNVSFPAGGTPINRINEGQTSYEYMRINDPVSLFTVGKIEMSGFDFTGMSNVELSFAAYISDFVSLELKREAVCFVNDIEVSRQSFDVSTSDWALVTIALDDSIDDESNVRIELQFDDLLNISYSLHVDNIQITVPDPASAAMLILVGGIAVLRKRR